MVEGASVVVVTEVVVATDVDVVSAIVVELVAGSVVEDVSAATLDDVDVPKVVGGCVSASVPDEQETATSAKTNIHGTLTIEHYRL